MNRKSIKDNQASYDAWSLDQMTRSAFFHEKLHEWQLLDVAVQIEQIRGDTLEWELSKLGISEIAWNKVIHSSLKPVIVFAHPEILQNIPRAVGYYRTLSMVSQKSMHNLKLNVTRFEAGLTFPNHAVALGISNRLNQVISSLIQVDEQLNSREFDLWRGMASGAQAQGSWGNLKGKKIEIQVKEALRHYLRNQNIVSTETLQEMKLIDGRIIRFGDEPDIAIYAQGIIQAAIEIKGGIDTAAILERVGAAVKSLSRARQENPQSLTILLMPKVSLTETAISDLKINQESVNYWFTTEECLVDINVRGMILGLLEL